MRVNYEVIKTEWDLALKEDHSSFEVNKMTFRIDQLLPIKEATPSKIHTHEPETEVHGIKKTLVQSLKQFHVHFFWLYEKGMTHAMIDLQGLHSGDAFRHPNISAVLGWSHSDPGVLNYAKIMKQLPSTSRRYSIGWQLCVTYTRCLPACLHRACLSTPQDARWSTTRSEWSM